MRKMTLSLTQSKFTRIIFPHKTHVTLRGLYDVREVFIVTQNLNNNRFTRNVLQLFNDEYV